VQVWGAAPEFGAVSFFRDKGGYLIRFHGIADFVLSVDGAKLHCHPVPNTSVPWEPIYRQQVLPLQLAQQGRAVFHGGAVCRADHAVVFLAPSGQGKSTLTAACAASGMAFLTDDCLVLREDAFAVAVMPDVDYIRVWEDSYQALHGSAPEPPIGGWQKPRLQADHERWLYQPEPVRLGCMIALDAEDGDQVVLQRLAPSDATMNWCANAFVVDQRDPALLRNNLQRGARLARQVPAYRLAYPRDYLRLPEVVTAVSACLDAAIAEKAA
jgi:hypothetical protein